AELRAVLPTQVDAAWGTGLSEALRTAAFYLRDVPDGDEKVLVVFGNGEDHSPEAVTAEELRPALEGAVVVRLNAGLVERDRWTQLYQEAGARAQLVYDQAATRLLTIEELKRDLERARQRWPRGGARKGSATARQAPPARSARRRPPRRRRADAVATRGRADTSATRTHHRALHSGHGRRHDAA